MFIEYLRNTLWVALGGALGAVLRYTVYYLFLYLQLNGFWATLSVNIVGSFVLGLLTHWLPAEYPKLQYLFLVGCLGAFTTFSTFSSDVIGLLQAGKIVVVTAYVLFSLIGGCLAFLLGFIFMRNYL